MQVRNFYNILAEKLFKYLPLRSSLLRCLTFLDVSTWSSEIFRTNVLHVAKKFPTVVSKDDTDLLEIETRRLPLELDLVNCMNDKPTVEEIWCSVLEGGNFPILSKLACASLTLFHGNADVERTNSLISNQNLRDKRNRLLPVTLEALIRLKMYLQVSMIMITIIFRHNILKIQLNVTFFQSRNLSCTNFPIPNKLIALGHNASAAYKARTDREARDEEQRLKEMIENKSLDDVTNCKKANDLLHAEESAAALAEEARLREVAADKKMLLVLEEKRKASEDRDAAIRKQQESAENRLKLV